MRIVEAVLPDLATSARIRDAALAGLAKYGFAGTSIRMVARAAGVSPGLVQHHFRSKARLVRAVNRFVVERFAQAVADVGEEGTERELAIRYGNRVARFLRRNPLLVAYVRRLLLQGDKCGVELFDDCVELILSHLEALAARGVLRRGLDLEWTALHLFLLNFGPPLLEGAISRAVGSALLSDEGLRRWRDATIELIARGIYRGGQIIPSRPRNGTTMPSRRRPPRRGQSVPGKGLLDPGAPKLERY